MADITITSDELSDPAIDDVVNLQKSVQNQSGERVDDIKTPFWYNPVFYYTLAAAIGAVAAWAALEPLYGETNHKEVFYHSQAEAFIMSCVSDYTMFGPIAGILGLSIGAVYGFANRNLRQAFVCGCIGAGVGLAVTMITTLIAEFVMQQGGSMAISLQGIDSIIARQKAGKYPFAGMPFFIHMCVRGIAWSIISTGAGLGLGVAQKSPKLLLNGIVGGMIGGLMGGLIFDPIDRLLTSSTHESATLSRCLGFLLVGTFIGIFIGIFENISKDSWFLMLRGPLTGKQFIVFKSPMLIGSSPKSDVYLFKDPDIAPLHASVIKSGSRYMLKDEGSDKGTFVNGRKIDKYILQPNDTITIGEAVLKYGEKARG